MKFEARTVMLKLTYRKQEKAEPPHKYVTETPTIQLRCSVFAVDMEGKADGRALKTLLPHMNPKKLVCRFRGCCGLI